MKTAIVQWNKNREPHALIGIVSPRQAVCTEFEVSRQKQAPRNFVVREIECDASTEPPRRLRVVRRAEFPTKATALAEAAAWEADLERKQRAGTKAVAEHRKREAQAMKRVGEGCTSQAAVAKGEAARVREAIKSSFAKIFPRSIKLLNTGAPSPAGTLRAYVLDLIEATGSASGFPAPEIDRATAAEISAAHRSFSRSTKRVASALTDLAIALRWLPPHNWREATEAEISDALKTRGFDVSPANVRKRATRLNLYCAREAGPRLR